MKTMIFYLSKKDYPGERASFFTSLHRYDSGYWEFYLQLFGINLIVNSIKGKEGKEKRWYFNSSEIKRPKLFKVLSNVFLGLFLAFLLACIMTLIFHLPELGKALN